MIRGVVVIEGSPKKMKTLFGPFVKAELRQLVSDWHEKVLPWHFMLFAHAKYKYDARGIEYNRDKKKLHLHPSERGIRNAYVNLPNAPDLVYSGASRDMMTRSIRITGTKRRATGTMQAPRYFWMNPPGHPRKSEEAVRLTKKEITAMADLLNKRVTKKLNMIKATKVVR